MVPWAAHPTHCTADGFARVHPARVHQCGEYAARPARAGEPRSNHLPVQRLRVIAGHDASPAMRLDVDERPQAVLG